MASQQSTLIGELWKFLCSIRGQMDTGEYKNYVLPFMFYHTASFKVEDLMESELKNESLEGLEGASSFERYRMAWDLVDEDGEFIYRDDLIKIQQDAFGFVIEPQYISNNILKRMRVNEYFTDVFEQARESFNELCCEEVKYVLDSINLYNKALGETTESANSLLEKLFYQTGKLTYQIYTQEQKDPTKDILGDAYEYLMSLFAGSAGKKGGEFYTPAQVSRLVAKIATYGVTDVKAICDPTCGSGSLLLKSYDDLKERDGLIGYVYGQELNAVTSRLAKMNMSLHGVNANKFHIETCDTLGYTDSSSNKFFDITVANPPYAVEWDNSDYRYNDDRFSGYGALAPRSNADLAFVQHIIHHMSENGQAAILLPLGTLFRGNAEKTIREAMIKNKNIIDSVIVLANNMFYGASIPVCLMVLKKNRQSHDVLFIDASNEFVKDGKKNKLEDKHIEKIFDAYKKRENIQYFAKVVDISEIEANDFNLNISLYVEAEKVNVEHDMKRLFKEFEQLEIKAEYLKSQINEQLINFGVEERFTVKDELANKYIEPEKTETAEADDGFDGYNF